MSKKKAEAIVLLNTMTPRLDDLLKVYGDGSIKEPRSVWAVVNEVIKAKVPITDEFKRKVDAYYNSLDTKERNKAKINYDALKDYEIDNKYYEDNKDEIFQIYKQVEPFITKINAELDIEDEKHGISQGEEVSQKRQKLIKQLENYGLAYDENKTDKEIEDQIKAHEENVVANVFLNSVKIENEGQNLSDFQKFSDDLNELFLRKGYKKPSIVEINNYLGDKKEDDILSFIKFASMKELPITTNDYITEVVNPPVVNPPVVNDPLINPPIVNPPVVNDPTAVVNDPTAVVDDPVVIPDKVNDQPDLVATDQPIEVQNEVPSQKTGVVPDSSEKLVYIERYHEVPLTLYFQNSSYPQWDHVLESNVLSLKISKEEIVMMMEDVIKEYGNKLFISKRKSDTLEELNELVQLQFCILRNLHLGDRSRTATVKLSDLSNLQKAASGGSTPISSTPLSSTPLIQKKEEYNFVKDYDELQHITNLKRGLYEQQINKDPFQKSINDPHTIGIVKGNNKASIKETKGRLLPTKKLVRT